MRREKKFLLALPLLLVSIIYLASCAVPPPTAEIGEAEQAVAEAKDVGAAQCAPDELAAAEAALARGKKLAGEFCSELEARRMLVDARAKAEEAKAKCASPMMSSGEEVGLKDVFFDFDRSNIRSDAAAVLQENAKVLNDNPNISVVIEGYADIRGSSAYNLRLAQRRADSTKAFLTGLGVDASRVTTTSGGETSQFAAGSTEESYQLNRRAHFVVPSGSASVGARLIFVVNK